MKILIVCSGNFPEPEKNFHIYQAFIADQISAIYNRYSVLFDVFFIRGKGVKGYLKNRSLLRSKIKHGGYSLVHAHFSLSGLLSVISSTIPVVISFHGSDINNKILRIVSAIVSFFSSHTIYVSEKLLYKAFYRKNFTVIPCGVDFDIFFPQDKELIRQKLGLENKYIYVLFSSSFNNEVKNYPLAQRALELSSLNNFGIMELRGYNRSEVNDLLSSADLALMTSYSEGSPQFIKEAMACNCPIVSTDVGDVKEVIKDTEGCYISSFDPEDVADKIRQALSFGKRTNGSEKIRHLDNSIIAERIMKVYQEVLSKSKLGK